MKFIKKIITLTLSMILIAVAALLVLVFVVDFNEYKPLISAQVEKATGRQLDIKGDIKIALWPWLGVQVAAAELSNAPGFGDQPFAKVSQFDLKLALMPLLQKQISVNKILFRGLALSLQKNAQGKNNWDDLAQPQKTSTSITDPTPAEYASGFDMGSLSIQGIEIKNGSVSWNDAQSQTKATLTRIDLHTGVIAQQKNIPLTLTAYASLNKPRADINIKLETDINLDMDKMKLSMNQVALELGILSSSLATQNTNIKIKASVEANLNQQQYAINHLNMDLTTRGYQLPGGELSLKMNSSMLIDLQQQSAVIEVMKIDSTGMQLTATANITGLDAEPLFEGELKLAEFNLLDVAQLYKIQLPDMSDKKALQKVQASMHYRSKGGGIDLSDIALKLDDSTISGRASVHDFDKPELTYDLKLNDIKLDRYLPAVKSQSRQRAKNAPPLSNVPLALPIDSLRKLNINGVFKADHMSWQDYQFNSVYIKTRSQKGVSVLNPINVRVFDGRVAMAVKLDVSNKKPVITVNLKAKDLQLESAARPVFLKILNEKKASLNGAVNANLKVNTQGHSPHELVSNLNGKFDFRTGKTKTKNLDIEQYLRQRAWYVLDQKIRKADKRIVSILKKNNFPTTEKDFMRDYRAKDKTAFNVIRAKANISQGVINNYDFLMSSNRLKVTGKGSIYLLNQRMKYEAIIDLNRPHNSLQDRLLDIPLKINFTGPMAMLKPQPDINRWLNKAWEVVRSDGKASIKRKARKKTKDKLKGMLKQWQF